MPIIMNCLIADDEPLARKGISNFVGEISFLHVSAMCKDAFSVIEELARQPADLLFLDINMPKMTGIELLKTIRKKPLTIITSAFPDYALVSYELDVIDYLVKPISFERFLKAVNKAKEYFEMQQKTVPEVEKNDFFFIKCDHRFEKIFYHDIVFVQAMQNYVVVQTDSKRYISYLTIKNVEDYLPQSQFFRVNKSYVIPVDRIESISVSEIKIGSHSFTISRALKEDIMDTIIKNKLLKRH
jgi:two-component system LytT family response regulator